MYVGFPKKREKSVEKRYKKTNSTNKIIKTSIRYT